MVYFEKCLIVEIYIIGYKNEGEAILFFVLALGVMRIFLTGDMEDDTIEKMPRGIWGDIACSTVYRKGHSILPLESVMKQYTEKTRYLFCTGKADKEEESEKYGIVKIVTDVIKNEYSMEKQDYNF